MWISRYLILFVAISFLGWVWETVYALIMRGRWESRGFLYGPICPIYGLGAVCLVGICHAIEASGLGAPAWWGVFLIACIGSAVLEYVTSWGLEKLFHARWWDYSEEPLNIQGRVCLPATLAFGVAGLLLMYCIVPAVNSMIDLLPPIWIEALALALAGGIVMDFALTISALSDFERKVLWLDRRVNEHMKDFVKDMKKRGELMESDIAKERDSFAKENAKQVLQYDSMGSRHPLRRVKEYHHPKIEANRMERIIEEVRKTRKKK